MEWLDLAQLNERAEGFDRRVLGTPNIDTFCSTSCWAIPAARAMLDEPVPFITESEDGFVAMMIISIANGLRAAVPLEIGWGLAAPFAGPEPSTLIHQVDQMWAAKQGGVDALLISGVPPKGQWAQEIVRQFIEANQTSCNFSNNTPTGLAPTTAMQCMHCKLVLTRRIGGFS